MPRLSPLLKVAIAHGGAAIAIAYWSIACSSLAAEPNASSSAAELIARPSAGELVARPSAADKPPADKPPVGESAALKGRNPRVLLIVARDCPRCDETLARLRAPKGDFEKMRSVGWKIGSSAGDHLQIVDREKVEALVERLGVKEFPSVVGLENGRIERSFQTGCTTPLDMWTFAWLLKGQDERPANSSPEKATAATTGHFPLRGNHWTIDGDWQPSRERLVSHLRGPVHGPQIAGRYEIEGWSYEELRSLHDKLHEVEMGGVQYGMGSSQSSPSANPFSAARKASGR